MPVDVIVLFVPNCPEYPWLIGGSSKAGLVTSSMNPAFTPGEASRQFKLCAPKVVITEEDKVGGVKEAIDKCQGKRTKRVKK